VGKVFISYSHDSPEHSERVLALSNSLRALGVDAELDRYHVRPPHGWAHWCEQQLRPEVSSFVLVVCTPVYRARVENRVGAEEGRGVYWEGAIVYNYLYNAKANARFIPVLLDDDPESGVPMPLDGHTRYRVRAFELSDPGFEALYRELTEQPEITKPALRDVVRLDTRNALHLADALPAKGAMTEFAFTYEADGDATAAREPSPDEEATAATAAPRGNFWSPFSDEASVARGEVKFWAIVETVLAIAVFWWIAIRYETLMLLTTSLFVAPLLLLRSEESTQLGVKWFEEGLFPTNWPADLEARHKIDKRLEQRWRRIGATFGVGLGLGLGYAAAKVFLVGQMGWAAFWGMVVCWAIGWIAETAVGTVTVAAAGAASAGAVAATAARARAVAVAAAAATVIAGAGGLAAVGAACAAVWIALVRPAMIAAVVAKGVGVENRAGVEDAAFLAYPSILLGISLATVIIRVAATICCLPAGYRNIPNNLRRLAGSMAPFQHPELLPGLPAEHAFRFNIFFSAAFGRLGGPEPIDKSLSLRAYVYAPFIFLPAWAYRFILKSTLWFWWILFIVGGAPRLDGGIEGLRADAYRKASAWIGIATTIFAVVGFGFGWLLKPWAENLGAYAPLPAAVALLVLGDWKSVPIVQWVTLASALSTIAVVVWTRDVYVDSQNKKRAARVDAQLPWLGHLVKWKTGFGAVGIALLMLYIALYANAVHHWLPVSDWAAGWLHRLYGAAATRLAPAGG
jgi:hypothetical protein